MYCVPCLISQVPTWVMEVGPKKFFCNVGFKKKILAQENVLIFRTYVHVRIIWAIKKCVVLRISQYLAQFEVQKTFTNEWSNRLCDKHMWHMWHVTRHMWHMWHVTRHMWHMWHVTRHMWHATHVTRHTDFFSKTWSDSEVEMYVRVNWQRMYVCTYVHLNLHKTHNEIQSKKLSFNVLTFSWHYWERAKF
jgi:hypothetical protein